MPIPGTYATLKTFRRHYKQQVLALFTNRGKRETCKRAIYDCHSDCILIRCPFNTCDHVTCVTRKSTTSTIQSSRQRNSNKQCFHHVATNTASIDQLPTPNITQKGFVADWNYNSAFAALFDHLLRYHLGSLCLCVRPINDLLNFRQPLELPALYEYYSSKSTSRELLWLEKHYDRPVVVYHYTATTKLSGVVEYVNTNFMYTCIKCNCLCHSLAHYKKHGRIGCIT